MPRAGPRKPPKRSSGAALCRNQNLTPSTRNAYRCRGAHAAERAAPTRAHPPSSEALAAAHLKFARFYLGADAFAEALDPLADALRLRPAYAEALLERAYALQRLGDAPGARADLLAADALAPGDVRVARALRALG